MELDHNSRNKKFYPFYSDNLYEILKLPVYFVHMKINLLETGCYLGK